LVAICQRYIGAGAKKLINASLVTKECRPCEGGHATVVEYIDLRSGGQQLSKDFNVSAGSSDMQSGVFLRIPYIHEMIGTLVQHFAHDFDIVCLNCLQECSCGVVHCRTGLRRFRSWALIGRTSSPDHIQEQVQSQSVDTQEPFSF
jgi:hypothetical protein